MLTTRHMIYRCALLVAMALLAGALTGCTMSNGDNPELADPYQGKQPVPSPLDNLLPQKVIVHAFTGKRTYDADGEPVGFEARVRMLDREEDPIKAYGTYSFVLYTYRQHSADPRGTRLGFWTEDLMSHDRNRLHWDPISQSYKFNLRFVGPMNPGQRYVLDINFNSPFTYRIHGDGIFTATEE
jgi:hypothetical protein